MPAPTRSSRPELSGPLPDPTRSRRTTTGKDQEDALHSPEAQRPSSDPGHGDRSGQQSINILGGYPKTPYYPRNINTFQGGSDQTPSQRTRGNLEAILAGSRNQSPARRIGNSFEQSPEESEESPKDDLQSGDRKLRAKMESLGGKEAPFSFSTQKPHVQRQGQKEKFYTKELFQPSEVEESELSPGSSSRNL